MKEPAYDVCKALYTLGPAFLKDFLPSPAPRSFYDFKIFKEAPPPPLSLCVMGTYDKDRRTGPS